MRLFGLDVGSKTVGVAISDELGVTAQPLTTIEIDESVANFGMKTLRKLVRLHHPAAFVVGMPKLMDGSEGASSVRSRQYGERLTQKFSLPVYYVDERLTTVESERILVEEANIHDRKKRKQVVDQMAAALILQSYLDSIQEK